jgi:hypothetical protein
VSDTPTPPGDAPEGPAPPPDGAASEGPPPPADGDALPAPPACAECGAELEADQTYCLRCGAPTPLAPTLRRRRGTAALAAGLAVLGLGTGLLAYAVADDGDSGGSSTAPSLTTTAPATSPTSGLPGGTTGVGTLPSDTSATLTTPGTVPGTDTGFVTSTSGTVTAPPDTTGGLPTDTGAFPTDDTTTTDTFTDDTDPAPVDVVSDWPSGTSAWTAVLASAGDPEAALRARSRARSAGFGAGILLSDDHPGLTPGLYVVYVGVYRDKADAVGMASRAQPDFPGAYPRFVSS